MINFDSAIQHHSGINKEILIMQKLLITCILIALLFSGATILVSAADTDNPRLVLTSYVFNDDSSETVNSGQFSLNYTLQNTSGLDVVNTILAYEQRESAILPLHGNANVEFIGSVNAGREYNGKIDLNIPDYVPTGLYRFDITLSYNVADPSIHAQLSGAYSIYISVINNPELAFKRVELSEELTDSNRRYLYIEYDNPGTYDFRNLQLVISGNIYEQQKTQTLPILKAGRSNSIEYPVQFTEMGIQHIDICILYNDDVGNAYQTMPITIQTNITDNAAEEVIISPPLVPPHDGYVSRLLTSLIGNLKNPVFIVTLLISIILIIGIALIVTRIRKRAIQKKWYYKTADHDKKKR